MQRVARAWLHATSRQHSVACSRLPAAALGGGGQAVAARQPTWRLFGSVAPTSSSSTNSVCPAMTASMLHPSGTITPINTVSNFQGTTHTTHTLLLAGWLPRLSTHTDCHPRTFPPGLLADACRLSAGLPTAPAPTPLDEQHDGNLRQHRAVWGDLEGTQHSGDGGEGAASPEGLWCKSTLRRRKAKMNKHKLKKRRRKMRNRGAANVKKK